MPTIFQQKMTQPSHHRRMINRFYRPLQILLLLLLVVFQSHSPYNVQAFAVDQNTLRRCLVEKDVHTVTQFVRGMATQTAGKECMAQLAKGSPWKAVFVLRTFRKRQVFVVHRNPVLGRETGPLGQHISSGSTVGHLSRHFCNAGPSQNEYYL